MRQLWLAPTEAKCTGSACRHPVPCARRDIPQDKGRPRADFSQPIGYVAECCAPMFYKHVPYSAAVKPAEPQKAREWIGSASA